MSRPEGEPLLIRAGWVLPVASSPVRSGAVRIREGRIVAVGSQSEMPPEAGERVIDLPDAALLPGLVNAHAHPELALFRGALENLPFPAWIAAVVRMRWKSPDPERDRVAARWTAIEALRAGITSVGATEASGAAVSVFTEVGLRGVVYQEVFAPDLAGVDEAMEDLATAVDGLRAEAGPLVGVGVSPHAPYTVCDLLYERVGRWSAQEGLPVAMHIAESAEETDLVARGAGPFAERLKERGISVAPRARTPIELLRRTGLLREGALLIHAIRVDEEDIAAIAASGAAVAHCPVANARLGHGIAPLLSLRRAGVTIGLGTDSVASNNRIDMLEEARIASLLHRATAGSPDMLPASDLLRMCTIDGARALGLADRVGTLEPGKEADLCAVSLAAPHVRPVHDVEAAVVHAARGSDVVLTMVAGRVLFRDGEVSTMDVARTAEEVERAAADVARIDTAGVG